MGLHIRRNVGSSILFRAGEQELTLKCLRVRSHLVHFSTGNSSQTQFHAGAGQIVTLGVGGKDIRMCIRGIDRGIVDLDLWAPKDVQIVRAELLKASA